jgi:hypothetical protein
MSTDLTKVFVPGIYEDIPAETYHAMPWCGSSSLNTLAATESPYKLMQERERPRSPPTDDMVTGTAIHTAILEPHLWNTKVEVVEERRSKADKERVAKAEADGKLVLRQWQHDIANRVTHEVWHSVWCDPLRVLLESATAKELTILWELDGLKCKSRLDVFSAGLGIITDIKSMDDNSPNNVQRRVDYGGWAIQSAFYTEAVRVSGLDADPSFVFATVDKRRNGCGEVGLYEVDATTLAAGLHSCRVWASILKACEESDTWEPARKGIQTVRMSDWQIKKIYE